MRKQIFLLVAFSCIIAGSVSTAAKSETFRTEMHEFINARGEKVKYPLAMTDSDNGTEKGPQDQVHIGQISNRRWKRKSYCYRRAWKLCNRNSR